MNKVEGIGFISIASSCLHGLKGRHHGTKHTSRKRFNPLVARFPKSFVTSLYDTVASPTIVPEHRNFQFAIEATQARFSITEAAARCPNIRTAAEIPNPTNIFLHQKLKTLGFART